MARQEKIICVGCPSGCLVTLTVDDRGEVTKVSGNKCKEGREYAINEYKNPVRVLTATVLTEASSQPLLPVRTDKPILRTRLREGMRVLAKVKAKPPLKVGDILIPNFLDIGVNLVASTNLPS
jgi:CxxC motif-containing protein